MTQVIGSLSILAYFDVLPNDMHERTIHKELHDPFAHYLRGVLLSDGDTFTFIAHRQPYSGLDSMSWTTEQAFMADYRRMIDQKYSL